MKHFFIHIPKTGGISLFENTFARKFVRSIHSNTHRKMFTQIQQICNREKISSDIAIKRFNLEDFDFLGSHISYGVHKAYNEDYQYYTVVRDPISHTMSWLQTLWIMDRKYRFLPSELIESKALVFDNYQTRFLIEDGFYVDKITKEHTKTAIKNMKQMLVGTTNNLNAFILKLCHLFELQPSVQIHNNTELGKIATNGKAFECTPYFLEEIKKKILIKNFSDKEIYEYAKSL